MPILAMKSICPACSLEDAVADHRTARRVGQYKVSDRAIYFPAFPGTRYLPFAAVRRAWQQKSSILPVGCCGKELPVVLLRMEYGDGFYQNFTFEKREQALGILRRLRELCPEIVQEAAPGPAVRRM